MRDTGVMDPECETEEEFKDLLFSVCRSLLGSASRRTRDPCEVVVDELANEGFCAKEWFLVLTGGVKELGCMVSDERDHDSSSSSNAHQDACSAKKLEVFKDNRNKVGKEGLKELSVHNVKARMA